eukprot:Gb_06576 [translate_table: standard]
MYSKCGLLKDARQMFDKMIERDRISWNSMIAGYAEHTHDEEALKLFEEMQRVGFKPDHFTFSNVLSVCAALAALGQGRHVHAQIISTGFESDVGVGNALVDMYAKCGSIEDARQVFDKMPKRNIISWNAMIVGYAQHGDGNETLVLFEQMQHAHVKPNKITFVGILAACNHRGLVDEGRHHFDSMSIDYGIIPEADHYSCMVGLLGRAGCLDEAEDLINKMPFEPDAVIWGGLLAACRLYNNMELGKRVAEYLFELEPQSSAAYVALSNIYASCGSWDYVAKMRKLMKDKVLKKEPGCSWIEVKNKVHVFIVEDQSHPQTKQIYETLEVLAGQMKEAGYVPDTTIMLNDME